FSGSPPVPWLLSVMRSPVALPPLQRSSAMAIYRILKYSPMAPEQITLLSEAYELTLRALSLVDRNDPITEIIARKIIDIGQTGVRDSAKISMLAIKELGIEGDRLS